MSRKRDSLMDLLILAPWWVSAFVLPALYLMLAGILQQVASNSEIVVYRMLAQVAATAWPYVFLGCGFFAVLSFIRRWRVRKGFEAQNTLGTIRGMHWKSFEELVGEMFRRKGYSVVERLGGGPDGGVDLVLEKDGTRTLVQCKRWRKKVGLPVVRELFGSMASEGVRSGMLVATSNLTSDALGFASKNGIRVIDGEELLRQIKPLQVEGGTGSGASSEQSVAMPACPRCGSAMVLRTARRGANAGNQFYGCSRYPDCKGTVSL